VETDSVEIRTFPYPYRAMFAICSDLDLTPNRHVYWEILRFLNTGQTTAIGPGVELEVGNSIYFDMPSEQFSYWNTDDTGREMIRTLIHSGHVDCLHSYGDLAVTRAHVGRALEELVRHDCRLEVWVDHGLAATNLGADIMRGHGDIPGHEAYHADLTIGQGVRYVWRGRVTSVIGQDAPASLNGTFTFRHPISSAKTASKELAKRWLGRCGNAKYTMHGPNRTLQEVRLRDGSMVQEFLRCNSHWAGVSCGEHPGGIGQVVTQQMLDRLTDRRGVCILYTHLGKTSNPHVSFPPSALAAFRRLAATYHQGRVLVTTTRRVLRYLRLRNQVHWSVRHRGRLLIIDVQLNDEVSSEDLAGLTFYLPAGCSCEVSVNGTIVDRCKMNPPDESGRVSVSYPWKCLEFPQL